MGKLIYIANISLDGYVADRAGNFGFTVPTPEVFAATTWGPRELPGRAMIARRIAGCCGL